MTRPAVTSLIHPDMPDPSVLKRIAHRLKHALRAQRVIVFGSVARGDATIHSDIDLLVIAPSTDKMYIRLANAREAIRDLSFGLPIAPLVLTPGETARRLATGDAFLQEVLETGVEL